MAALIIEGWDKYQDGYGNSLIDHIWLNEWVQTNNPPSGFVSGAYSGQALRFGQNSGIGKNLGPNISRAVFGVRFRTSQLGVTAISFCDVTTPQVSVFIDSIGKIEVYRGYPNGGVLLATSSQSITNNVWHYLEGKFTINSSTGAYDVYLDGVHILSASGQNLQATGNASVNSFQLNTLFSGGGTDWDDLYVFDTTGSFNNDVVGDSIVETQWPSSDDVVSMTVGAGSFGAMYAQFNDNANTANNQIVLRRFAPPANCIINSVSFIPQTTNLTAKFKGVIYTDNVGSPNALMSSGTEVTGSTNNAPLNMNLVSPQVLTGGTFYWIGYITDSATRYYKQSSGGTGGVFGSNTYAGGAPGTAPSTTLGPDICIWGNVTTTEHWTQLRDAIVDPLTHYVTNTAVNDQDLYGFPNLSSTPVNVWAVKVSSFCIKTDAGSRTIDLRLKSGATTDSGSTTSIPVPASYAYLSSIWNSDPNTGLAWAGSTINAAKSGVKVTG